MAELVHDAFETRHHAIVEAGTGPEDAGIPTAAICSGRRVVISTATKSLQNSSTKKIFLSAKTFRAEPESGGDEGRSNFLCRAKLHQMADSRC